MIIGTFYDPDGNPLHVVQPLQLRAPRRRRGAAAEGNTAAGPGSEA